MNENLFEALHEKTTREHIFDQAPALAEDAKTWLGRLTLLHGVPFHYLVPDERMLPPESLRFFYVDPLWMAALLNGALSVGPSEDIRVILNKVMAATYTKELIDEARKIRIREQLGPDEPMPTLAPSPVEGSFKFSGFLLRSEIVAGWRGLSVVAFSKPEGRSGGGRLATLRLERLARDVLFGLVEGDVRSLEITQPPEGLHFEVKEDPKKYPRRDDDGRVLDVMKCKQSLDPGKDNSAAFAVRLLATPVRYTFSITD